MKHVHWLVVLSLLLGANLVGCIPPELMPQDVDVEEGVEEPQEEAEVEQPVEEEPAEEPTATWTPTSDATATATDTPEPTATAVPSATPTELPIYGLYDLITEYLAGNIDHAQYIKLLEKLQLDVREGSIIFDGEGTWVDVTGELQPDGSFEAQGTGTVAGFPNILVTFTGTIDGDGLRGEYTMGADGKLPGGESITYSVVGTRVN
jgi:hypothetical protein